MIDPGRLAPVTEFAVALSMLALSCTASAPGNLFVGSWSCTDTQFYASSGTDGGRGPGSEATTAAVAAIMLAMTDQMTVAVAATDGGPSCRLRFLTTGNTALLGVGQSCDGPNGVMLSYAMGSASVAGNAFTASLSFDFAAADASGVSRTGSGTEELRCDRIVSGGGVGGW